MHAIRTRMNRTMTGVYADYRRSSGTRSRSPSIPRRAGSPSFLDRRRITRYQTECFWRLNKMAAMFYFFILLTSQFNSASHEMVNDQKSFSFCSFFYLFLWSILFSIFINNSGFYWVLFILFMRFLLLFKQYFLSSLDFLRWYKLFLFNTAEKFYKRSLYKHRKHYSLGRVYKHWKRHLLV